MFRSYTSNPRFPDPRRSLGRGIYLPIPFRQRALYESTSSQRGIVAHLPLKPYPFCSGRNARLNFYRLCALYFYLILIARLIAYLINPHENKSFLRIFTAFLTSSIAFAPVHTIFPDLKIRITTFGSKIR